MSRHWPQSVLIALTVAALVLVQSLVPLRGPQLAQIVDLKPVLDLVAVWTLLVTPVSFLIPRVKAMRAWRVPLETYFIPLWLLRLWLACSLGFVLAFTVLAIVQNVRNLWISASFLTVSVAFWLGARSRLRHPEAEYEIPRFRWIFRGFGWRLRR